MSTSIEESVPYTCSICGEHTVDPMTNICGHCGWDHYDEDLDEDELEDADGFVSIGEEDEEKTG